MKKLIMFSLLAVIAGCQSSNLIEEVETSEKSITHTSEKTLFYKDLDLFSLEGINQIQPDSIITYPFVTISKNVEGDSIELTVELSPLDTTAFLRCAKVNDNWLCERKEEDRGRGENSEVKYSIHTPTKIIEISNLIERAKNAPLATTQVTQITKKEILSYTFSRFEKSVLPLKANLDSYPLELAKYKDHTLITISDDNILQIHSTLIDVRKNSIKFEERSCFNISAHSWFWWYYAGYLIEKVDCFEMNRKNK